MNYSVKTEIELVKNVYLKPQWHWCLNKIYQ
jgi:hypothetical protein